MNVIDISRYQQTFDASIAKNAGVKGVIVRNAYATQKDALALSWAPGIKAQGLLLGGYGFATWHYQSQNGGSVQKARTLMRQQVNVWMETARESGCDFWFAVDQEAEQGQSMGLGKQDNTALLNEACDMLRNAGLYPCIYCSVSWDMNYIRTSELRYDYWMARYYDNQADFGSAGASLDMLPDDRYTRWMRQLREQGRLIGWQFASIGFGKKYGAGSINIDRNVFYRTPLRYANWNNPVQPQQSVQYVAVGPLSAGDLKTVQKRLDEMLVDSHEANGILYTNVPLSTGDQADIIRLATDLQVPVRLGDQPFQVKS